MRTVRYIFIALASVVLGCVEQIEDVNFDKEEVFFRASFGEETKTVLVGGKDVYWLPGDKIAVCGADDFLTCTATEPTPTTDFKGYVSRSNVYYACYPHSMYNNFLEPPQAGMILPSTQKAVKDGFANELNASVACANDTDRTFRFRNVLGYVKFTLPADTQPIVSVTVETINNEPLSGSFRADCTTGQIVEMSLPSVSRTVQLLGDPVMYEGTYYIAMRPGTYAKGLKFTFKNKAGQVAEKTISKSLKLSPGQVRDMGTVANLSFKSLPSAPVPPDDEIWYITSDGTVVPPTASDAFGVNIVSNTYKNGKGIIKFDGPVTVVGEKAFYYSEKKAVFTHVYLPESVTEIGPMAFNGCEALQEFTIPSKVTTIGRSAFYCSRAGGIKRLVNKSNNIVEVGENAFSSSDLCEVAGEGASADGRSIILDGKLLIFARGGVTEYTVPSGVTILGQFVFCSNNNLVKVTLPEGLKVIETEALSKCGALEQIVIPESVESLGKNAFSSCKMLRSISFPDKVTALPTGVCQGCSALESVYLGSNLANIGDSPFINCSSLKSVTIPDSVVSIGKSPFSACTSLSEIRGKFATDDNKALIYNDALLAFAPYGMTGYIIPSGVKTIGEKVFYRCEELMNIEIPEGVQKICMYAFANAGLTSLTLPSTLKYVENFMFKDNAALSQVYCLATTPPSRSGTWYNSSPFDEGVIIRVPANSVSAYQSTAPWKSYRIMSLEEDIYTSTDFSKDGTVKVLQSAKTGNGIDLVFMGDAYSDRQIASGKYDSDIRVAMEHFFAEEPYASMRDMFNVYQVTAVSAGEGYGVGTTAFDGYFGNGTEVGGDNADVITYARKALSYDRMDEAMIVVIMNRNYYAGTCYMYYPGKVGYGNGLSISYFPLGTDDQMLGGLIRHEAGGHGFAKLADEYSYKSMGEISAATVSEYANQQNSWGWWKNVDFTDDPKSVRWSHFLNDGRYGGQGLGVFEGGLTYWRGVWRPTQESIMNHNTGGYNAPSREAIYYRAHKLAYGESWTYDYDTFVDFDAAARSSSVPVTRSNYVQAPLEPTPPPVVIKKSWRDEFF